MMFPRPLLDVNVSETFPEWETNEKSFLNQMVTHIYRLWVSTPRYVTAISSLGSVTASLREVK